MARVSFKVAPGVRISASSRGLRTSVGNSRARVSVGGGRTYTSASIAGVRVSQYHSSASRPARPRVSASQLERETQAEEIAQIERALTTLHLEDFPHSKPPQLPSPTPVDVQALVTRRRKESVSGIGFFKRAARRAAQERAERDARHEAQQQDAANLEEHRTRQAQAESFWQRLVAHESEAVLVMLDGVFADNASEATCVDAGTDEGKRYATVVVVFPSANSIPERTVALTPAGNTTTRKRTKSDRNALYVRALGSTVLATVKEAFTAAPSLDEVRIVVLRKDPDALSPSGYLTVIYTAEFGRERTQSLPWAQLDPAETLLAADDARLRRKGAAGDVIPVEVDDPALSGLVAMFADAIRTAT